MSKGKVIKEIIKIIRDGAIYDGVKEALDSEYAHEIYDALNEFGDRRSAEARRIMENNFNAASHHSGGVSGGGGGGSHHSGGMSSGGGGGDGGRSSYENWYREMERFDNEN